MRYRVGVRTRANIPYGSCDHFCRIGAANAIVLPDPVFAPPIQSRPEKSEPTCIHGLPSRTGRIHAAWMGVGRLMDIAARA